MQDESVYPVLGGLGPFVRGHTLSRVGSASLTSCAVSVACVLVGAGALLYIPATPRPLSPPGYFLTDLILLANLNYLTGSCQPQSRPLRMSENPLESLMVLDLMGAASVSTSHV